MPTRTKRPFTNSWKVKSSHLFFALDEGKVHLNNYHWEIRDYDKSVKNIRFHFRNLKEFQGITQGFQNSNRFWLDFDLTEKYRVKE